MDDYRGACFVIMPFAPEMHYFYLYLAQHIEQHHNLRCERVDAEVLPKPFLDKINDFIRNADVIRRQHRLDCIGTYSCMAIRGDKNTLEL